MKFFRFYFLNLKLNRKARGFTLTELLVVVGIMTIMNLLIFANYPEFSQRMALKKTSDDVALVARQAQAYSLGIKRPLNATDDTKYTGFGIHFDKSSTGKKSLIIFADKNGGTYDDVNELFQEYKINTGDVVGNLRACKDENDCSSSTQTLDIFYPRATPVAKIAIDGVSANNSYAEITIQSPKKKTRIIKIWISGQVLVEEGKK